METKFKIYTQKTITNQDGTTQNVLIQLGSATREELVKACDNAINQLIRAPGNSDYCSSKSGSS